MASLETKTTAADYLRMAEELEAMAANAGRDPQTKLQFAERLAHLAKQLREDSARLTPASPAN